MARGINKATIIGNLGRDPEAFNGGCRLAVATDESYKDKNTGQMVPKTEWHSITVFGRLGEICLEYLRKGSKVYIEGRLQTDKYQKDGADHYQTKIIANDMRMLDSKPNSGQSAPQQGYHQAPQQQPQAAGGSTGGTDDFDDDIPFAPVSEIF